MLYTEKEKQKKKIKLILVIMISLMFFIVICIGALVFSMVKESIYVNKVGEAKTNHYYKRIKEKDDFIDLMCKYNFEKRITNELLKYNYEINKSFGSESNQNSNILFSQKYNDSGKLIIVDGKSNDINYTGLATISEEAKFKEKVFSPFLISEGINSKGIYVNLIITKDKLETSFSSNRLDLAPSHMVNYILNNARDLEDVHKYFSVINIVGYKKWAFYVCDKDSNGIIFENSGNKTIKKYTDLNDLFYDSKYVTDDYSVFLDNPFLEILESKKDNILRNNGVDQNSLFEFIDILNNKDIVYSIVYNLNDKKGFLSIIDSYTKESQNIIEL